MALFGAVLSMESKSATIVFVCVIVTLVLLVGGKLVVAVGCIKHDVNWRSIVGMDHTPH